MQLLPTHDALALITVLPEQLQSPLLTAEWEYRLGEIQRGELDTVSFMEGIAGMLRELVQTYHAISGSEFLFSQERESLGPCPRCGGKVTENRKGFCCENKECQFAIWKDNKWWADKKKQPTKAIVSKLLKDGRARVSGLYSERTKKTYTATVLMLDKGNYVNFSLEFK